VLLESSDAGINSIAIAISVRGYKQNTDLMISNEMSRQYDRTGRPQAFNVPHLAHPRVLFVRRPGPPCGRSWCFDELPSELAAPHIAPNAIRYPHKSRGQIERDHG
jgi:hypothetical protein